ncbi:hypothetical protein HIM_12255 [Hirsutella minnesotensis 3608]|uniref:PA14 domain-containing protein n=1 Tax=Hirsutella minnesotensis 3608 TaxID=1043627 RepID=A0A0F8A0A1_9HYPO|nr:hypothetical protein HIM_12255 [Hirsutella minnesotensis 3608]
MLSRLITSSVVLGLLSSVVTADFYPITGIKVQGQNPPPRRNINELQAEAGPQWDLYVQAIAAMQSAKSTDPLSWFQLSSIHGSPPIAWNNTAAGDGRNPGYCAHGEAQFLTWHRPYIVAFEQSLVNNAKEIARQYPTNQRARYVQAADILRTPFWDWAASPRVPKSTVPSTLTINTAHGRRSVKNPLAGFVYPQDALNGAFGQFSPKPSRRQVTRCPSPKSYPQSANSLLRRDNLRELVYDAFIYSETFEDFSSTAGSGTSIEQTHNLVHNYAACGQTMGDLGYAAYDPLFWLHHTNVDRLYALWQAAHPDKSRLTTTYRGKARFTTQEGSMIGPDSPLSPFYLAGNRPHTSNTVVSTDDLGYTYEGLEQDTERVLNLKRDDSSQATEEPSAPRLGYKQDKSGLNQQKQQEPQIIISEQIHATYTIFTQQTHQPAPLPQPSSEEYKRLARSKVTNLYAGPAHKKKRTVHRAHVNYRAEELPDRPCVIDVYLCGFFIGDIVALNHPHKGSLSAAVPLNEAIETCNKRGIKPENYHSNIGFSIKTASGRNVPLSEIPSLKMEHETLLEIPPAKEGDFPTIRNRQRKSAPIKQYKPPQHSGYEGEEYVTTYPRPGGPCQADPYCAARGLNIDYYNNSIGGYSRPDGPPSSYYITQNLSPLQSQLTNLTYFPQDLPPNLPVIQLPLYPYFPGWTRNTNGGIVVDANNFTLVYYGFYRPPVTGTYTLCSSADNENDIFFGHGNAFSCVTGKPDPNAQPLVKSFGGNYANPTQCTNVNLVGGRNYPIRSVMGNWGGPSALTLTIQEPGGKRTSHFPGRVYPHECGLFLGE